MAPHHAPCGSSAVRPIPVRTSGRKAAVLFRRRLEERGITGEPLGPEAFTGLVTRQVREIGGLVAGLGMQLD